jgi:AAA+ ATPase superfamily predicted ATPase
MAEQNPYHPHLPPDDPSLFYGRQDAAAFLRQRLVGAHNRHIILILGRLGIGKTALLHHVDYIVDERYASVYLNVAEIDLRSTSAFILSTVEAIVARMEILGASTYRVPSPPDSVDETGLRQWFADDFLDVVLTAIRRDRFLLLMLDDFQAILDAIDAGNLPSGFMDYLGGLLDRHERLDMLATIDVHDEDRISRYPLTSHVHFHYRLQHLDSEAARQLIIEPVAGVIQYTEDAIQRILSLCGGYPFLLHSVCRLLYRLWEGSPQLITGATLDYIYTPVLEETGEILRDWWGKTTPNMQAAIRALLAFRDENPQQPISQDSLRQWLKKSKTRLNETQLFSTLRALEYSTLVKTTEDGSYFFSTGLEADWLRMNLQELEAQRRASRLPNRTHVMGVLGILVTLLIIGVLLASGILQGDDETKPLEDAPPTSTFGVDIDATRAQATRLAVPSATLTPSVAVSDTATSPPSRTPHPTHTPKPTATRTPRPTQEN